MSRSRRRHPIKRELEEAALATPKDSAHKLTTGDYFHVAEIHGPNETRGLRPWARDRVLARAS